MDNIIIEIIVQNHPGVMSHITGLFARRSFNLEGIICGRLGDGTISRIFLLVHNDHSLEQIIKQLKKLYDVMEVIVHDDITDAIFKLFDNLSFLSAPLTNSKK